MNTEKVDMLRVAIQDALCDNHCLHSRVRGLMHVFNQHQNAFDGIIIGWIDVQKNPPEINSYADIKYPENGISNEMLITKERLQNMRLKNAQWKPTFY